jgi:hypothetical protein
MVEIATQFSKLGNSLLFGQKDVKNKKALNLAFQMAC